MRNIKPHVTSQGLIEDKLPERTAYKDDGCDVSDSCFVCPLWQCKYDDPFWYQQYRKNGRDSEVISVYKTEGATIHQLAQRFGVSARTIHRALRRARSFDFAGSVNMS
jgi:hypothetical protein